jgi:SET domain-containing protein
MNTYKPLPKSLAIKESPIHGYGLFAIEDIPLGTELGITHVFAPGFHTNYIRTPLGGFINHSDTPNCCKVMSYKNSALDYYTLQTAEDIKSGEELTLTYTIYGIDDATS